MDWTLFAIFFAACGAAASTGAMFQPGAWYDSLDKPRWTPPDWMFPVAWTLLYIAIAAAAARVAVLDDNAHAMAFWAMQIAFNTLWSPVFFGLRRIGGAVAVMAGLWVAVLGTFLTFWLLDRTAGLLIAPYLVWVSYAGALNIAIWLRERRRAAAT